jgi:predicted small metal-binding protein
VLKIDIYQILGQIMATISCRDYGFNCDFVAEGELEEIASKFGKHSSDEHGIEYSIETITKFILNKSTE